MKAKVYTVSELTYELRQRISSEFDGIWVEGEIRDFKVSYSGHAHFVLTDGESSLRCVIFAYWAKGFARLNLREGMKIRSFGRIDIYARSGVYQQIVEIVVPWGTGVIATRYEDLKRKLASEGVFDERRKRRIPSPVSVIGLVTSPVSAALRDFIKTLRKAGGFKVIFAPVQVQGEDAPSKIARAIRKLGRLKGIDVIVVTRGGGSKEDLSAFNEEVVVRAIAESPIPVISAVGHSVDITLSDLASDLHLYTPTAAAELLAAGKFAARDAVQLLKFRLVNAMRNIISWKSQRLSSTARILETLDPRRRIILSKEKLKKLKKRLYLAMISAIEGKKMQVSALKMQLAALNPLAVLDRGFALLLSSDGKMLDSTVKLRPGQEIFALMKDGRVKMEVLEIESEKEKQEDII